MALTTTNCKDTIIGLLSDLPSLWREQVATALCAVFMDQNSVDCDVVNTCQTTTNLSAVTITEQNICIRFTNEDGVVVERCFTFTDIVNSSLDELDPKCIATQEEWDSMTYQQRVQAIIAQSCLCSGETTSTTTTTTEGVTTSTSSTSSSSTTTTTVVFGDFTISHESIVNTSDIGTFPINTEMNTTGYVDWGDGSAPEFFDTGGGTSLIFNHEYIASGQFTQTFYFDQNAITQFSNAFESGRIISFTHSDNFNNLISVTLNGVEGPLADFLLPAASNISSYSLTANGLQNETVIDLTGLSASVISLYIRSFVFAEELVIPSTVTGGLLQLFGMPVLTDVGTIEPAVQYQLIYLPQMDPADLGALDYSVASLVQLVNDYDSSEVDTFLVGLESSAGSGGFLICEQSPPAPPGPTGDIEVAALQARGWTVIIDS